MEFFGGNVHEATGSKIQFYDHRQHDAVVKSSGRSHDMMVHLS